MPGLKDAFLSGLQSTKDAFDQDVEHISRGQLPEQALKALTQILGAYNTPGGVFVPKVAQYVRPVDLLNPQKLKELESINQILRDLGHNPQSVDLGKEVFSGAYKTMPQIALESPASGRIGQGILALRKLMLQAQQDLGIPR